MKRPFLKVSILAVLFIATDSHSESQWDRVFNQLNSKQSSCPTSESDKDILCQGSAQQVCDLTYQSIYTPAEGHSQFASFLKKQDLSQLFIDAINAANTLKKEIGKIKDKPKSENVDYEQLRPLIKKYVELTAKIEEKVFEFTQLSPQTPFQVFEDSKTNLATELDAPKKTKLHRIQYLGPSVVLKKFDQLRISTLMNFVKEYTETCTSDGMYDNAFYVSGHEYFTVCPGFYLSSIDKKNTFNASALYWVIGHELGHAIDTRSFPSEYKRFLGCVQKNDLLPGSKQFHRYQTLEKISDDTYDKSARMMASSFSSEYWQRTHRFSLELKNTNQKLFKSLNSEANKTLNTQKDEIVSDYYGIQNAMKRILRERTPEGSKSVTLKTVAFLCDGELNAFDGKSAHPASRLRIEMILRNPGIRKQLGCTNVIAEKPWCD